jgi:hypothetical protein
VAFFGFVDAEITPHPYPLPQGERGYLIPTGLKKVSTPARFESLSDLATTQEGNMLRKKKTPI